MGVILEPKTFTDLVGFVQALGMAVQGQLLSQEQAKVALKDQLYEVGLLKRPAVPPVKEEKKREVK